MSLFTAVPKPDTDFRDRLLSVDPAVRRQAEIALEELGSAAGDVLMPELAFVAYLYRQHRALLVIVGVTLVPISGVFILQWRDGKFSWWSNPFWFSLHGFSTLTTLRSLRHQTRALGVALTGADDPRALLPLLESVDPRPSPRVDADAERATVALTRLLTRYRDAPGVFTGEQVRRLQARLDALYPADRGWRWWNARASRGADITDAQADLLATAVTVLARGEDDASRELLARIAAFPAETPNRRFVRDAARAFLEPTTTDVPHDTAARRYAPVSTPAAVPLTVRRP